MELEENIRRKDLTSYEQSKAMVQSVEVTKEDPGFREALTQTP